MSHQEITPNKPVHLIYLVGSILLFFVLTWLMEWVWGTFSVPPMTIITLIAAVVAIGVALYLYRHNLVRTLAGDVAEEIERTDWPKPAQVRKNTFVVIATAIIAAIILMIFDGFWSKVTELLYG